MPLPGPAGLVILIAMRLHQFALSLLAGLPILLGGCNLVDSANNAVNVASVKFSEGSPAVDGQNIVYSGNSLTPGLGDFKLKMVFHVKADNSANSGKAAFGTDAIQPILKLRINSRSSDPIAAPIPSFSVDGGAITTLAFPIEIPVSSIDRATLRKIVNGEAIPYFLSGTLKFDLLDGTTLNGTGSSTLDLASGEISTRPSSSVQKAISALLDAP
jgi:hypothetical protein